MTRKRKWMLRAVGVARCWSSRRAGDLGRAQRHRTAREVRGAEPRRPRPPTTNARGGPTHSSDTANRASGNSPSAYGPATTRPAPRRSPHSTSTSTRCPTATPAPSPSAGASSMRSPTPPTPASAPYFDLVPAVLKRTGTAHARAVPRGRGRRAEDARRRHATRGRAARDSPGRQAPRRTRSAAGRARTGSARSGAVRGRVRGRRRGGSSPTRSCSAGCTTPDAGVRKVCRDALVARDRSDDRDRARPATHARRPERAAEAAARPALRRRCGRPGAVAGAAQPRPGAGRSRRRRARRGGGRPVARTQSCPVWVGRVADADQHPTVRFVAGVLPCAARSHHASRCARRRAVKCCFSWELVDVSAGRVSGS